MPRLILASTSPYRKAQLEQLGLPFETVNPRVDEDVFQAKEHKPKELALQLAVAKARAVAAMHPAAIVVGGDQLVSLEGTILGKPGDSRAAIEQLIRMNGKRHDLITAIAVVHREVVKTHVDQTRLTMRFLEDSAIERYVFEDEPYDCAGSYKIESKGITLFEKIESEDHTAITGLPLLAVTSLLNEQGIVLP